MYEDIHALAAYFVPVHSDEYTMSLAEDELELSELQIANGSAEEE